MAKYKPYSSVPGQLIPVIFSKQIQPGTFEFTLNHLIDHELDLAYFDHRFKNDETGAPAFDPRILLKIILFAYSRGITSSRKIDQCCEENVIFLHGPFCQQSAPFHHHLGFYLLHGQGDVCHRRLQTTVKCCQRVEWHQGGISACKCAA